MREIEWQRRRRPTARGSQVRVHWAWRASSGDEGNKGCLEQVELLPVGRGRGKENHWFQ